MDLLSPVGDSQASLKDLKDLGNPIIHVHVYEVQRISISLSDRPEATAYISNTLFRSVKFQQTKELRRCDSLLAIPASRHDGPGVDERQHRSLSHKYILNFQFTPNERRPLPINSSALPANFGITR